MNKKIVLALTSSLFLSFQAYCYDIPEPNPVCE